MIIKKVSQGIYSQPLLVHQRSRKTSLSSERSFQKSPTSKKNLDKSPLTPVKNTSNDSKIILRNLPNL